MTPNEKPLFNSQNSEVSGIKQINITTSVPSKKSLGGKRKGLPKHL